MASHLFGTKSLFEPKQAYYQLGLRKKNCHILIKKWKFDTGKYIWKFHSFCESLDVFNP